MENSIKKQFKLYVNDTGLLCAMYGFETKKAILNNTIKGKVKGGIYENIIGECLVKKGYKLYYKPDDDQEIEFLIENDGEVIPIEVKPVNTSITSLNHFIKDYHCKTAYKLASSNIGVADKNNDTSLYNSVHLK